MQWKFSHVWMDISCSNANFYSHQWAGGGVSIERNIFLFKFQEQNITVAKRRDKTLKNLGKIKMESLRTFVPTLYVFLPSSGNYRSRISTISHCQGFSKSFTRKLCVNVAPQCIKRDNVSSWRLNERFILLIFHESLGEQMSRVHFYLLMRTTIPAFCCQVSWKIRLETIGHLFSW